MPFVYSKRQRCLTEAGPESEASPDAGTTSETSSKSKSSSQTPKEDGGTGHHRGHHHRDKTSKGEAVHVPGVVVTRDMHCKSIVLVQIASQILARRTVEFVMLF